MQKIKNFRGLLMVTILLFVTALLLFANQSYKAVSAKAQTVNGETDFDIEKVAIKDVVLTAEGGAVKVCPGESIAFSYSIFPAYAADTVEKVTFSVVQGANYATVSDAGVLTVKPNATVYESIGVQVVINETSSNVYQLLIDKIPVQSVTLSASSQTILEGESMLVSCKVLPLNASFKDAEFEIIDGSEYATIHPRTGRLQVNKAVRNGSATVSVRAIADNIVSNVLTFQIYTPTKSLQLVADDLTPVSQVTFKTFVSEFASSDNPALSVISGGEYVESFNGSTLMIKQNISVQKPQILVRAEQDGLKSDVTLNIRIPLKGISIFSGQSVIQQGAFLQLGSPDILPANSTDRIEYQIINGGQYASVSNDGLISVNDSISVPGAQIQVRANFGTIVSNVLTFDIFVPAERVDLSINSDVSKIQYLRQGLTLPLTVNIGGVSTLQEYRYVVESGAEFVTIVGDSLMIRDGITASNPAVIIHAVCGAVRSNTIQINIIIPGSKIELNYPSSVAAEGESLHLLSYKITPANASDKNVVFEIVAGAQYGTIDAYGTIKINRNLTIGNAQISVRAKVLGTYGTADIFSETVTFSIYVPTDSLSLNANKYTANISSGFGDQVSLQTAVDASASANQPVFHIGDGFASFASVKNNILSINKNITSPMRIPVWAEQDGVQSNVIYITVHILVNEIVFNNEITIIIEQFRSYDYGATALPSYANDRSLTYSINVPASVATITSAGVLTVNGNAPVGTKITLTIQSGNIVRTEIFKVVAIDVKQIEFNQSFNSFLTPGDMLSFEALLDKEYKSLNHSTIMIEGADPECLTQSNNTISIKSTPSLEYLKKNSFSFTVRLKAFNGTTSNAYSFTVRIPVDKLTAEQTFVNRGEKNTVGIKFNDYNFAYDKGVEVTGYQNIVAANVVYDKLNATFAVNVPAALKAGTQISFKITSAGNRNISVTLILIVDKLKESDFAIVYAKEDSAGYYIDQSAPQLWAGRSLSFDLKWKNMNPEFLGLTYSNTTTNGKIAMDGGSSFKITTNDRGLGSIGFTFTIQDGDHTYRLTQPKEIVIFRPAGSDDFIHSTPYSSELTTSNSIVRDLNRQMSVCSGFTTPSSYLFTSQNYNMTLADGYITDINTSQNYSFLVSGVYFYNGKKVAPEAYKIFSFLPSASLTEQVYTGSRTITGSGLTSPSFYIYMDTIQLLLVAHQLGKKVQFNISADLKEIDCGYQHFYGYIGFIKEVEIFNKETEYGGTGQDWLGIHHPTTSWGNYTQSSQMTETYLTNLVEYRYIVLAFGSSGSGSNDWVLGTTSFYFSF